MCNHDINWDFLFSASEEEFLRSLASYISFLASYQQYLSSYEHSTSEILDSESQIIASLLLIKNLHVCLLNRKTLLYEKKGVIEDAFFENNDMEQSMQKFQQSLSKYIPIKKNYKQRVTMILKEISSLYLPDSIMVIIDRFSKPSFIWKP
ncbi:hypothetical protein [Siminovitchia fordii]|uniref:Maturase K n=1 Tax=Siminovitchia fordii TaxID=254759 RepID=A0ABQ4K5I7_9BACI|nr:hypothetical protein [Siminovitchia fordii]GIN20995.1 hypothetical protein J1TS3_21290 [Siminovitchia fordii]